MNHELEDADVLLRISSGEMHPALVDAFGLVARVRAEHDELEAENAWLKRRISEEDARLARG